MKKAIGSVIVVGWLAGIATAQPGPPPRLPAPPVPPQNPITADKAVLGKILFWDEQLSSTNRISCGTCHRPGDGGADPRIARAAGADGILGTPDDVFGSPGVPRSDALNHYIADRVHGYGDQVTRRNSPNFLMAAYSPELFWDGRAGTTFIDPESNQVVIPTGGALEQQAIGPVLSPEEMANDGRDWATVRAKLRGATPLKLATALPPDVSTALARDASYPALFRRAFGDPAITAQRIAMAIATYERTLIPNQTPYDAFSNGNPMALTQQQHRGFRVFNQNGRCNACHSAPTFSNNTYRAIGVRAPAEDTGRMEVTNAPGDRGRFKVPSLRNVALKDRYMHTGDFTTLPRVVDFYGNHEGNLNNRDPLIGQIQMSPQERTDVVAFLQSLTDPRVAAEQAPFDRPTLYAERVATGANLFGNASPGSGSIAPAMLADVPANRGNPDFRIGIGDGLGGAPAWLVVSTGQRSGTVGGIPYAIDPAGIGAVLPVRLSGSGAGTGSATLGLPLPNLAALAGTFYVQWFVVDAAATGGVAVSRAATIRIF